MYTQLLLVLLLQVSCCVCPWGISVSYNRPSLLNPEP